MAGCNNGRYWSKRRLQIKRPLHCVVHSIVHTSHFHSFLHNHDDNSKTHSIRDRCLMSWKIKYSVMERIMCPLTRRLFNSLYLEMFDLPWIGHSMKKRTISRETRNSEQRHYFVLSFSTIAIILVILQNGNTKNEITQQIWYKMILPKTKRQLTLQNCRRALSSDRWKWLKRRRERNESYTCFHHQWCF